MSEGRWISLLVLLCACGEVEPATIETSEAITARERLRYPDFDGDGFSDLVMAAPHEDVNGFIDNGAVIVLYGQLGGVGTQRTDLWTLANSGVGATPQNGEHLGAAVAWGDFDADGYSDLAAGLPGRSVGGAVLVVYGTAQGLSSARSQLWTLHGIFSSLADESGDRFGSALATGGLGDTYTADGLAIGIPGRDRGDDGNVGAVVVLEGRAGESLSANTVLRQQEIIVPGITFDIEVLGVHALNDRGGEFGFALAAGDDDGDGRGELAVGAPFTNRGTNPQTGTVYVVDTSQFGIGGLCRVEALEWGGTNFDDNIGFALAMGDLDNDGFDDLAIGAPSEDGYGSVRWYPGRRLETQPNCLTDGINFSDSIPKQITSTTFDNPDQTGTMFGSALAIADINSDNYADTIIGAPWWAPDASTPKAGAVHIVGGGPALAHQLEHQVLAQTDAAIASVAEAGDRFGYGFVVGDFDHRFGADVAVQAPFERCGTGPHTFVTGAGAYEVFYSAGGSGNFLSTSNEVLINQNYGDTPGSCEANDHMGYTFGFSSNQHN